MDATPDKSLMIEGSGISKVFKDFWERPKARALDSVDISVYSGDIFGLLGPNGAGKSTLIKILLGHLYPTSGSVRVLGRDPRDVAAKSRIGYLPERTSFYATLTGDETLKFFSALLGLPGKTAAKRIDQLIEMVGLSGARKRLVGEYSHGMRKRLGLAQALLNDPDLLLLDEPTAGMDPIGCREIKDLMRVLKKRGKTIFVTSHLLADVQDVSSTIMILFGGRVCATGSIDRLLAKSDEILIKCRKLDPESMEKVREEIESLSGTAPDVSTPVISLEEYFLSVVSEAHRAGQDTSGVRRSMGIAQFLTEE